MLADLDRISGGGKGRDNIRFQRLTEIFDAKDCAQQGRPRQAKVHVRVGQSAQVFRQQIGVGCNAPH